MTAERQGYVLRATFPGYSLWRPLASNVRLLVEQISALAKQIGRHPWLFTGVGTVLLLGAVFNRPAHRK